MQLSVEHHQNTSRCILTTCILSWLPDRIFTSNVLFSDSFNITNDFIPLILDCSTMKNSLIFCFPSTPNSLRNESFTYNSVPSRSKTTPGLLYHSIKKVICFITFSFLHFKCIPPILFQDSMKNNNDSCRKVKFMQNATNSDYSIFSIIWI